MKKEWKVKPEALETPEPGIKGMQEVTKVEILYKALPWTKIPAKMGSLYIPNLNDQNQYLDSTKNLLDTWFNPHQATLHLFVIPTDRLTHHQDSCK